MSAILGRMSVEEETLREGTPIHGLFYEFNNLKYWGTCRKSVEWVAACCRDGKYMDPGSLESILAFCERSAEGMVSRGEGGGLNEAEITVLLLYSAEFLQGGRGSFYTALNAVLRNQNREMIKPFKHVIWLLMWALKACPPCDDVVFRGVKLDISGDYIVGRTVYWQQFSSCTKNEEILKQDNFLGTSGTRVMFEITPTCQRARSISAISVYPGEEEVLFPPNTPFLVEGKMDEGNGLVRVLLREKLSFDLILDFNDLPVTFLFTLFIIFSFLCHDVHFDSLFNVFIFLCYCLWLHMLFQLSEVAELEGRIAALEALVVFAEQDKARAVAESLRHVTDLETQLAQAQVSLFFFLIISYHIMSHIFCAC